MSCVLSLMSQPGVPAASQASVGAVLQEPLDITKSPL